MLQRFRHLPDRLTSAQRDLGLIVLAAVSAWFAIERTETCDRVFAWIAANPDTEVDSMVLAFILASLGVAVFAWRRYAEMKAMSEARELAEARYHALALHDPLTGLANRRALGERMQQAFDQGEEFVLMLIDLDRFKSMNDVHGHAVGDRLLQLVSGALAMVCGPRIPIFRLGGDEFAVIMPDTRKRGKAAQVLADSLLEALAKPFDAHGHSLYVGASIGVAFCPQDGKCPISLMRAADVALYEAKDSGRRQYRQFDRSMDEQLQHRATIEAAIRTGIPRGEFVPFLQPLVSLADGRIEGYEVLARWRRDDGEPILPSTFISIAEDCGLINDLILSLLDQACQAVAGWAEPPRLEINLSPNQLRDAWITQRILAVLTRNGFPPGRLGVEITEDAIIADEENARRVIASLKNQGVRIALDDFGTGYSSLHHLRSLPFDRIKIDRSFVRDLALDENAIKIVKGILGLAANLDLPVTAEGIEDAAQAELLYSLGCSHGQGYHFGRPGSAETMAAAAAVAGRPAIARKRA